MKTLCFILWLFYVRAQTDVEKLEYLRTKMLSLYDKA